MDKAELSRLLEQQVQEKLKEGYSITTYALDAASRDGLKRSLKAKGHAVPNENHEAEDWQDYIEQLGSSGPKAVERRYVDSAPPSPSSSGSVGLWKARRH
ncbi:hypothetical protein [Pseudomonas putida]|uniref:Uncharacterized protein n=1 Tax=Pseudomonas putida TaxID=303 RepID=A0A7V8EEV7_PSEPU|nr:hypothetical protein [Pseudomonas putida]KAF0253454.1 hypothetical protein GN299_18215 [Pseudomonas putida]